MAKIVRAFVCLVAITLLIRTTPLLSQDKQDPLKETVEVHNVELIVRVLLKGKPLAGLTKQDFLLLENGKFAEITSCTEVKRKIGTKKTRSPNLDVWGKLPVRNRLFLLYFWTTERGMEYREPLIYFFEKIFRTGDTVLMVVRNKYFQMDHPSKITPALNWLDKEVEKTARAMRTDNIMIIRTLETLFREYILELQTLQPDEGRLEALRNQINHNLNASFQAHKNKHLLVNNRQLILLARELKKLKMDKWSIVFFQDPAFPQIDIQKLDHQLFRRGFEEEILKMKRIIYSWKFKTNKPNVSLVHLKSIKQAFVNGETTFHLLWMSSENDYLHHTENMAVDSVFSGWKQAFHGITKVTGGEILDGDRMKESLAKVIDREDIFYRITYAPSTSIKKKRKIVIKVNRKGARVTHLKQVSINPVQQT